MTLHSGAVKIICAPDSFKDCLAASAVAEAMQRGISRVLAQAEVDCCPVADGGEGTALLIAKSAPCTTHRIAVNGPLGATVEASFYCAEDQQFAVLDMASAAGLMLVPSGQRDVMRSNTYGVGELLLAACSTGARRVIVGVGGSAGNDGGCGMAQALGVRFLDSSGRVMTESIGGADLSSIGSIDATRIDQSLREIDIVVACDVDNPFTGSNGAARVYAAQKGASDEQIAQLDSGLQHLAEIIRRDLGKDVAGLARAGAAGGLAGGLLVFAGAVLASGVDIVLDAVQFDRRVRGCDLCLTGEGRLDSQSLAGKACLGVARHALSAGVPTVALVGSVGEGAGQTLRAGLSAYELIGEGLSPVESMKRAEELLANAAERIVTKFLRRS